MSVLIYDLESKIVQLRCFIFDENYTSIVAVYNELPFVLRYTSQSRLIRQNYNDYYYLKLLYNVLLFYRSANTISSYFLPWSAHLTISINGYITKEIQDWTVPELNSDGGEYFSPFITRNTFTRLFSSSLHMRGWSHSREKNFAQGRLAATNNRFEILRDRYAACSCILRTVDAFRCDLVSSTSRRTDGISNEGAVARTKSSEWIFVRTCSRLHDWRAWSERGPPESWTSQGH